MLNTRFKKRAGDENPGLVRLPHLQRFAVPEQEKGWHEEPTTICGDILHAAHAQVERSESIRQPTTPYVEAMLGVISYCYTKGLFNSSDIEGELWQSQTFLTAFGDRLPTAPQIRSFRRRNRSLILSVIEQAIQEFSAREPQAVRKQVLAAEADLSAPAQVLAQWLLDMASYSDSMETG